MAKKSSAAGIVILIVMGLIAYVVVQQGKTVLIIGVVALVAVQTSDPPII